MNLYKKYLIFTLLIPLPIFVALGINLYLYDPAQIFHKPYFREKTFFEDMRVSAYGIIKHYDFDSYMIGNSMLHNTSAKEAKEKLGGEWVNLTMSSSAFDERAEILKYLFARKQPKQILYVLGNNVESSINRKPKFLYNEIYFDDWRFYVNERFVMCSLVWSKDRKCVGNAELESLTFWKEENLQDFFGIENWIKLGNKGPLKDVLNAFSKYEDKTHPHQTKGFFDSSIEKIQEDINKNILSFVEQNKTTKFYFIVPTYSRLSYKVSDSDFQKFKLIVKWFVKELESYPNATLYGFDDLDYADKIINYRDLGHYNVDMNSMQLDAIKEGKHILTTQNIEEYLETMEEKIQNYDVESIQNKLKEAMQKLNQ